MSDLSPLSGPKRTLMRPRSSSDAARSRQKIAWTSHATQAAPLRCRPIAAAQRCNRLSDQSSRARRARLVHKNQNHWAVFCSRRSPPIALFANRHKSRSPLWARCVRCLDNWARFWSISTCASSGSVLTNCHDLSNAALTRSATSGSRVKSLIDMPTTSLNPARISHESRLQYRAKTVCRQNIAAPPRGSCWKTTFFSKLMVVPFWNSKRTDFSASCKLRKAARAFEVGAPWLQSRSDKLLAVAVSTGWPSLPLSKLAEAERWARLGYASS